MKILNKVMLVPKMFLVFPFSSCNGTLRASYGMMSFSVGVILFSIILSVWHALYDPLGRSGWPTLSTQISRGADTIHVIYGMASIITYAARIRKVNKFIQKLSEARKYLAGVGYTKKISVSYRMFFLDLSLLLFALALIRWNDPYIVATSINYTYIYCSGSSLIFMYCSFLNIIGNQLEFLNDKTQILVKERHFKEKTIQLAKFSDGHHALCSAAEALQESHGYPLVILFLSFFIKILVLARSIISNMAMQSGFPFSLVAIIVSVMIKLCVMVRSAAFTSGEVGLFCFTKCEK